MSETSHLPFSVEWVVVVYVCSRVGGEASLVPVRVWVWKRALLHLCLCSRNQLQPLGHVISHRYGGSGGIKMQRPHRTAIIVEICNRVLENNYCIHNTEKWHEIGLWESIKVTEMYIFSIFAGKN